MSAYPIKFQRAFQRHIMSINARKIIVIWAIVVSNDKKSRKGAQFPLTKKGTGVLPFDKKKLHKAKFNMLLKCYNTHYFDNIFLEVDFFNIYISLTSTNFTQHVRVVSFYITNRHVYYPN